MTQLPATLLEQIRKARHIAVLTGAGISAESGIPTFRDAQSGLWERFKLEDLATVEAFERNPQLVWDWYAMRREMIRDSQPNAGHRALALLETHAPAFTLVTQNIDSLHQKAGSSNVLELHGNIARVKCFKENIVIPEIDWVPDETLGVPHCPRCNALLRPDVVWFGEHLPMAIFQEAEAGFDAADLVLSIGTSGLVPPAATLPVRAIERGAYSIEVNPNETYLSDLFDACLRGPAGIVIPALVSQAWPDSSHSTNQPLV